MLPDSLYIEYDELDIEDMEEAEELEDNGDLESMIQDYLDGYGVDCINFTYSIEEDDIDVEDIEWDLPESMDISFDELDIEDYDEAEELDDNGELFDRVREYIESEYEDIDDLYLDDFSISYDDDTVYVEDISWS